MKSTCKIFRIFGIDIRLHLSWWLVLLFLAWSLSTTFFPELFLGYDAKTYWIMGISSALLLFVSVLLHELSHSLIAKLRHIQVESITLFFFGGVASINDENLPPLSELLMALAGPIFSLVLAGIFYLINYNLTTGIIASVTFYLYNLNLILALFNLIPGFPLDGGRALRAILNAYFKDLKKATKIAVAGGKFFAIILFCLGFLELISGFWNGIWFIFLGGFLYFVSGASYEQVAIKEVLSKVTVKELLRKKIIEVDSKMNFAEFIQKYADSEESFFLIKDKDYIGVLDVRQIQKMPPEEEKRILLKQISLPLSKVKSINLTDNAYTAFKILNQTGMEMLPVKQSERLLGFVTHRALTHRLIWGLKFGVRKEENKKKRLL